MPFVKGKKGVNPFAKKGEKVDPKMAAKDAKKPAPKKPKKK